MVGNFVKDELSEARAKLDALNEALTKFKTDNAGKLPEQFTMNMAQMTSLQQRLATINDSLNRSAQDRVLYEERLATLQNQMALNDSLDKELEVSAPTLRQNQRLIELNKRIQDNETQLTLLRHTYKDTFPDIRIAVQSLNDLKKERDDLQKQQDEELAKPPEPAKKVTNYQRAEAVSNLEGQIRQIRALMQNLETQVANEKKQQAEASKDLQVYEARLSATSGLEAKYAELTHDIRKRASTSTCCKTSSSLRNRTENFCRERPGKTWMFSILPSLPIQPSKPNRWMYVGGGTAIAFILGLASRGGAGSEGYFAEESEGRAGLHESSRTEQHSAARKHDARAPGNAGSRIWRGRPP